MLKSHYVEDIFIEFYENVDIHGISVQSQDKSALTNFYGLITVGKELTENQANFIIKLLNKYKFLALRVGLDYSEELEFPKWKKSFRIIDMSRKLWVDKDSNGKVWINLKFPYQLKSAFEDELPNKNNPEYFGTWDDEKRCRKFEVYEANLILIHDFAIKHGFEIDETFLITLGEIEEIWQEEDSISPYCNVVNDRVILFNCSEDTEEWFEKHKSDNIANNLFLAKSMGFPYRGKPNNIHEKLCSYDHNQFWVKDSFDFVQLCQNIEGKIVFIVDRSSNIVNETKEYISILADNHLDKNDIRVCFRLKKEEDTTNFNQWIKDNGYGGSTSSGKYFIFEGKPPKWLFKDANSVKLLVCNNLTTNHNGPIARDWFDTHPCVIYLGNIKPTLTGGRKIVEL
jgi:hypothetical protein